MDWSMHHDPACGGTLTDDIRSRQSLCRTPLPAGGSRLQEGMVLLRGHGHRPDLALQLDILRHLRPRYPTLCSPILHDQSLRSEPSSHVDAVPSGKRTLHERWSLPGFEGRAITVRHRHALPFSGRGEPRPICNPHGRSRIRPIAPVATGIPDVFWSSSKSRLQPTRVRVAAPTTGEHFSSSVTDAAWNGARGHDHDGSPRARL